MYIEIVVVFYLISNFNLLIFTKKIEINKRKTWCGESSTVRVLMKFFSNVGYLSLWVLMLQSISLRKVMELR